MIEDLLNCKDLYDPIEGDNVKSSDTLDANQKKLKKKTLCHSLVGRHQSLQSCCQRNISTHFLEELRKPVRDKEHTSKDFLDAKLMNLKIKEGQSIAEHLTDFKGMIEQLSVASLSLNEKTRACFLLGSLSDSWNTLVVSLGNSASKGKVSLAMVRNSLFNEEICRKDFVGNDTHALITKNRGGSKSRGPFGHNKSRGRSKSRGKIKCYHCGKIGYMKRNYKILKQ